jgi:hypothetical protein
VRAGVVAELARQDVEVEPRRSGRAREGARRAVRGREDLEILAVGSVEADPDRLGDVTVEEDDTVDGFRVLRVVGEHEQRPPP